MCLPRQIAAGFRAPTHGPNGGVADSLDEAKAIPGAAWDACENSIARMTFLSQCCPAPRASKRGAFEPRQTLPKRRRGSLIRRAARPLPRMA